MGASVLDDVPGVGDVTVFGVGDYSMRTGLAPDKPKSLGLSTNDAVAAVRHQHNTQHRRTSATPSSTSCGAARASAALCIA